MFHPVGTRPPSVYWRRRIVLGGTAVLVLVLLIVTVRAATSGGGSSANVAASTSSVPPATPSAAGTTASPSPTVASTTSHAPSSSHRASSASSAASSSAPPAPCTTSELRVQAVVAQSTYQVGAKPVLELQVTDVGSAPCVQDLADKQIVLKVYNGESRVWGSHDCEIQPGTDPRVLSVGQPVRVSITWSGLTSQPNDCSSRQRVGAGTYTLYATLSGHTGTAAQFSIS